MAKKKRIQRKPRPLARGDGLKPAMKPINWPKFERAREKPAFKRPSTEEVDRVLRTIPNCERPRSRGNMNEPVMFDPTPLVPRFAARDIHDYFVSSLGTPENPNRLRELSGSLDWPIESVCGVECARAIDAAVTLLQCMRAAYGVQNREAEMIRAATLRICEVVCFG